MVSRIPLPKSSDLGYRVNYRGTRLSSMIAKIVKKTDTEPITDKGGQSPRTQSIWIQNWSFCNITHNSFEKID